MERKESKRARLALFIRKIAQLPDFKEYGDTEWKAYLKNYYESYLQMMAGGEGGQVKDEVVKEAFTQFLELVLTRQAPELAGDEAFIERLKKMSNEMGYNVEGPWHVEETAPEEPVTTKPQGIEHSPIISPEEALELEKMVQGKFIKQAVVRKDTTKCSSEKPWGVFSEKNPKWCGGCYGSEKEAKERLGEVEMFKSMKGRKAYLNISSASDDELFDELARLENMRDPSPDNEEQRQATISKVKQELWDRGFTRKDMKKETRVSLSSHKQVAERGEGQGAGGPLQGDGGADVCVCSKCGYEKPHQRGIPCNNNICPKCGITMVGKKVAQVDVKKRIQQVIDTPWQEDSEIEFVALIEEYWSDPEKQAVSSSFWKNYIKRLADDNDIWTKSVSDNFLDALQSIVGEKVLGSKTAQEDLPLPDAPVSAEGVACPSCGSTSTKAVKGLQDVFICMSCGVNFNAVTGEINMLSPGEVIYEAANPLMPVYRRVKHFFSRKGQAIPFCQKHGVEMTPTGQTDANGNPVYECSQCKAEGGTMTVSGNKKEAQIDWKKGDTALVYIESVPTGILMELKEDDSKLELLKVKIEEEPEQLEARTPTSMVLVSYKGTNGLIPIEALMQEQKKEARVINSKNVDEYTMEELYNMLQACKQRTGAKWTPRLTASKEAIMMKLADGGEVPLMSKRDAVIWLQNHNDVVPDVSESDDISYKAPTWAKKKAQGERGITTMDADDILDYLETKETPFLVSLKGHTSEQVDKAIEMILHKRGEEDILLPRTMAKKKAQIGDQGVDTEKEGVESFTKNYVGTPVPETEQGSDRYGVFAYSGDDTIQESLIKYFPVAELAIKEADNVVEALKSNDMGGYVEVWEKDTEGLFGNQGEPIMHLEARNERETYSRAEVSVLSPKLFRQIQATGLETVAGDMLEKELGFLDWSKEEDNRIEKYEKCSEYLNKLGKSKEVVNYIVEHKLGLPGVIRLLKGNKRCASSKEGTVTVFKELEGFVEREPVYYIKDGKREIYLSDVRGVKKGQKIIHPENGAELVVENIIEG